MVKHRMILIAKKYNYLNYFFNSPPITPYTSIRTLTEGLKVLSTNAEDAINDPAMQTARHPNLLHNADTTGPESRNRSNFFNLFLNIILLYYNGKLYIQFKCKINFVLENKK